MLERSVAKAVDQIRRQFRVYSPVEMRALVWRGKIVTYLNSSLSSANPEASASTASSVPMFRNANIAR